MQRLRVVIVAVCFTLLFAARAEACSRGVGDRVTFDGFERVTHLSTSGMNLWVKVTNLSCWRMVVADAEVDIYVDGDKRLTVSLRDRVVVPRRGTSEVLVPIRITSHSMFSIVGIISRIATGCSEDITIDYRVRAGMPLFKRRLVGESVAIDVLLEQLEFPQGELGILNRLLDR